MREEGPAPKTLATRAATAFHILALELLGREGRRANQSRISVICGETRQDYNAYLHGRRPLSLNRVAGWLRRWEQAGLPPIDLRISGSKAVVFERRPRTSLTAAVSGLPPEILAAAAADRPVVVFPAGSGCWWLVDRQTGESKKVYATPGGGFAHDFFWKCRPIPKKWLQELPSSLPPHHPDSPRGIE